MWLCRGEGMTETCCILYALWQQHSTPPFLAWQRLRTSLLHCCLPFLSVIPLPVPYYVAVRACAQDTFGLCLIRCISQVPPSCTAVEAS